MPNHPVKVCRSPNMAQRIVTTDNIKVPPSPDKHQIGFTGNYTALSLLLSWDTIDRLALHPSNASRSWVEYLTSLSYLFEQALFTLNLERCPAVSCHLTSHQNCQFHIYDPRNLVLHTGETVKVLMDTTSRSMQTQVAPTEM